jgi:hypothetical protein
LEGYFGEPDQQGRRQVFKLKGLSERSEYNGKTFVELSTRDQRRLRNTALRAIHIKQLKPSRRNDSVFHIFERLNTGGTRLKPQEIRNAVYRGEIVKQLKSLNDNVKWRKILGLHQEDKSQKDVEIVLRLFSLFESWETYEKPMLGYLNRQMQDNRDFSDDRAKRFKRRFKSAVELLCDTVPKPFRPRGVINVAMLDCVMIALLEDESIEADRLKAGYEAIASDAELKRYTGGATTDTQMVRERIRRAKGILRDVEV